MSLSDTMGKHIAFYYCGINHLVINLAKYIEAGIEHNELICIYCESSLYEYLIKFLEKSNISTASVVYASASYLIELHKGDGAEAISKEIDNNIQKAKAAGYRAVRWIGQPSLLIKETSKLDFLNFERDASQVIKGKDVSYVCLYDFDKYMNGQEAVDKEVIDASKETHTHQLYQFELVEM